MAASQDDHEPAKKSKKSSKNKSSSSSTTCTSTINNGSTKITMNFKVENEQPVKVKKEKKKKKVKKEAEAEMSENETTETSGSKTKAKAKSYYGGDPSKSKQKTTIVNTNELENFTDAPTLKIYKKLVKNPDKYLNKSKYAEYKGHSFTAAAKKFLLAGDGNENDEDNNNKEMNMNDDDNESIMSDGTQQKVSRKGKKRKKDADNDKKVKSKKSKTLETVEINSTEEEEDFYPIKGKKRLIKKKDTTPSFNRPVKDEASDDESDNDSDISRDVSEKLKLQKSIEKRLENERRLEQKKIGQMNRVRNQNSRSLSPNSNKNTAINNAGQSKQTISILDLRKMSYCELMEIKLNRCNLKFVGDAYFTLIGMIENKEKNNPDLRAEYFEREGRNVEIKAKLTQTQAKHGITGSPILQRENQDKNHDYSKHPMPPVPENESHDDYVNRYLNNFRVHPCPEFQLRGWCPYHKPKFICFKYHFPNSRRRQPYLDKKTKTFNYHPEYRCMDFNTELGIGCKDECSYRHADVERLFHPQIFKTELCQHARFKKPDENSEICPVNGPHCCFAHHEDTLRKPLLPKNWKPSGQLSLADLQPTFDTGLEEPARQEQSSQRKIETPKKEIKKTVAKREYQEKQSSSSDTEDDSSSDTSGLEQPPTPPAVSQGRPKVEAIAQSSNDATTNQNHQTSIDNNNIETKAKSIDVIYYADPSYSNYTFNRRYFGHVHELLELILKVIDRFKKNLFPNSYFFESDPGLKFVQAIQSNNALFKINGDFDSAAMIDSETLLKSLSEFIGDLAGDHKLLSALLKSPEEIENFQNNKSVTISVCDLKKFFKKHLPKLTKWGKLGALQTHTTDHIGTGMNRVWKYQNMQLACYVVMT